MKTNKNRTSNILRVIVTITLLLTATFIYAQPGGPGGGGIGGGTGGGGNPPAVPIDGGVVMLVAGAALYGHKLMTQNQTEETK